jgi:hypothetical protein
MTSISKEAASASATALVNQFFKSPGNSSPDAVKNRLRHWIEVAATLEQSHPELNRYEVATLRRNARENARKLAKRHPLIADELMRELAQHSSSEAA